MVVADRRDRGGGGAESVLDRGAAVGEFRGRTERITPLSPAMDFLFAASPDRAGAYVDAGMTVALGVVFYLFRDSIKRGDYSPDAVRLRKFMAIASLVMIVGGSGLLVARLAGVR
jgi:hypothetical protein